MEFTGFGGTKFSWNTVVQLSIAYYAATFSQTMPLLMHLFIYRFFAMKMWLLYHREFEKNFQPCSPQKLALYTPLNTAMIVLGTVITESNIWWVRLCALWGIGEVTCFQFLPLPKTLRSLRCWGSYFLYAPDPETVEYVKPFFVNEFAGFDYLAQLYWVRFSAHLCVVNDVWIDLYVQIGDTFRWTKASISLSFDIFLGSFLTVIIYCSFKIFKHFEWVTIMIPVSQREIAGKTRQIGACLREICNGSYFTFWLFRFVLYAPYLFAFTITFTY